MGGGAPPEIMPGSGFVVPTARPGGEGETGCQYLERAARCSRYTPPVPPGPRAAVLVRAPGGGQSGVSQAFGVVAAGAARTSGGVSRPASHPPCSSPAWALLASGRPAGPGPPEPETGQGRNQPRFADRALAATASTRHVLLIRRPISRPDRSCLCWSPEDQPAAIDVLHHHRRAALAEETFRTGRGRRLPVTPVLPRVV